jgi:hypothetical protein
VTFKSKLILVKILGIASIINKGINAFGPVNNFEIYIVGGDSTRKVQKFALKNSRL